MTERHAIEAHRNVDRWRALRGQVADDVEEIGKLRSLVHKAKKLIQSTWELARQATSDGRAGLGKSTQASTQRDAALATAAKKVARTDPPPQVFATPMPRREAHAYSLRRRIPRAAHKKWVRDAADRAEPIERAPAFFEEERWERESKNYPLHEGLLTGLDEDEVPMATTDTPSDGEREHLPARERRRDRGQRE